ncbi:DNA cytosine methyltransferase [Faucicola boevrei]|uniref:DNA cytosine methyltransferase n=1 Tax=Faucicola boevrei TaxID=346665 RepID=UPI00036AC2D2|nr:DNA cytosine methyltransferase [Moraxella boevrei]
MRFLSLFSGIEACSVAWKKLGWQCVGFSEIEPFPCALLDYHYPDIPNLGDVTKITEEQIKALGQIDLVVFGSPCTDLSVAGKRQGLKGQASGLFYDAIRIIEWARKHNGCRFALWENVPGAFSSNKGADFAVVVRLLSGGRDIDTPKNGWGNTGFALGKNGLTEWRVLDAQYFGLAQRRKRVFAITDFGDWTNRPPILLERESLSGVTTKSRKTSTQKDIPYAQRYFTKVDSSKFGLSVYCFETRYDKNPIRECHGFVAPTLTAAMGTGGGNIPFAATAYAFSTRGLAVKEQKEQSPTLTACDYKEPLSVFTIAGNVIGRDNKHGGNHLGLSDNQTSYTLTTSDRHAVAYPVMVRRLTPVECERLMGFPDNYTQIPYRGKSAEECPNSPRYKALGNSMATNVMLWIGKQIDKVVR